MTERGRSTPRRPDIGRQERGDRTREHLIDETVRCIREEGFSAASARHIVERAGVSWGVIQHHFGGRDGLFTAVIEDAVDRLVTSLEALSDPNRTIDADELVRSTWAAFANPKAMAGLEILIAAKEVRLGLDEKHISRLGSALAALSTRVEGNGKQDEGRILGLLLWTTPVAMMIAEMFATTPLPVEEAQAAIANLISRRR